MPHVLKMKSKKMGGRLVQGARGAPSWMLENAKDLLSVGAKHCYRRGKVNSATVYYVNGDSHMSTPITKERVMVYVDGLVGITNCRLAENFASLNMGLHCIAIDHNLITSSGVAIVRIREQNCASTFCVRTIL